MNAKGRPQGRLFHVTRNLSTVTPGHDETVSRNAMHDQLEREGWIASSQGLLAMTADR